jgi:hypothetical protein
MSGATRNLPGLLWPEGKATNGSSVKALDSG